MITQEKLKEFLRYNKDTGLFIWIKSSARRTHVGDVAGYTGKNGYVRICLCNKYYLAHRLAWLYVHGKFPEFDTDHINRIKDDNRISNLRSVTHRENLLNQKMHITNTSGVTGVYMNKYKNKWRSLIHVDGSPVRLGTFDDKFEAICARKSAEKTYLYHDNHGS